MPFCTWHLRLQIYLVICKPDNLKTHTDDVLIVAGSMKSAGDSILNGENPGTMVTSSPSYCKMQSVPLATL